MSFSLATERPLAGIRVIDQACGLCGRLLADLGAEVICVEPPGGAASRRMAPFHNDTSLYFTVRNLGKKSVTLDMDSADDRRRLDALLDNADVWIESHRAPDLNRREILDRHPQLIITSITPFGLNGPYRDYQVTDAVLVAMSGLLFRSGAPDRPPLLAPGALTADIAGTTAAFGTVMALYNRTRTGRGDHLDVSIMEAAAQTSDWAMPSFSATKAAGGQYFELRTGNAPIYSMYPCADGFVRLIILNRRQWRAMRAWLGEPEVVQADHFDFLLGRMQIQADILDPLYAEFFKDKTKVELALEAQRRGLAMTPVLTPDEVLAADHFAERKSFRDSAVTDGVNGRIADGFFILDGRRLGFTGPAPATGAHDRDALTPVAKHASGAIAAQGGRPFAGLRVLDFGIGGVGVEAGRLLAENGADVIKIETRAHPDFIRAIYGTEMNPAFASSSRCKRSLGINLRTERGRDIIMRLAADTDIVIENSATGTMEKYGLSFEQLREINPRIILASSQMMGASGPWKDWIGFGPNCRTATGMTYLWNFPEGGMPPGSGAIHPDHTAGRMLALGAIATLFARERRAAEVPRGHPAQRAHHRADRHRHQRGLQRQHGAGHHPAQHVPAELVGPEQVRGRRAVQGNQRVLRVRGVRRQPGQRGQPGQDHDGQDDQPGPAARLPPQPPDQPAPPHHDLQRRGRRDGRHLSEPGHQDRSLGSTTVYSRSVSRLTVMKPSAKTSVTPWATA